MKQAKLTFDNSTIRLDGNEFEDCEFTSCTFLFGAAAPFTFRRCRFNGGHFKFDGAADLTLSALKAIASMGEPLTSLVVATVKDIVPRDAMRH